MKQYFVFIALFICCILKGQTAYQHTTNSGNVKGYMTNLTYPNLDNNADVIIKIMPNRNLDNTLERNDAYTKNYGVWYNSVEKKWKIFTEDQINMPVGLTFNVLVKSFGRNAFTITANSTGVANHGFHHGPLFPNDAINNKRDAIILVTHNGGIGNLPILNDNSLLVDYSEAHNQ